MSDSSLLPHLLQLADDPDPNIWESVKASLIPLLTPDQLPHIQQLWNESENSLQAERLELLLRQVQLNYLAADFAEYLGKNKPDLKSGLILLNRIMSPEFSEDQLNTLISPLRKDIWLELSDRLTALEKVRIINHLLFEKYQLQNKSGLDSRSVHLYLPTLLKAKTGHPLTITALFCLIARFLDLPIYKVSTGDLPALAYLDVSPERLINPLHPEEYPVLFYMMIDRQMEIFGRKQFIEYVNHLYPTGNQNDEVVHDNHLLRALLLKLKLLYQEENNTFRKEQIIKLLSLF